MDIWAFSEYCGPLINIIVTLSFKILLLLKFVNTWFFKSELSPYQFPIGKIINNKTYSIATALQELTFFKILRQMHFEFLYIFNNFMNGFLFATKITKSHFFVRVFYIFRNWAFAPVLFFYWVLVAQFHQPIANLNEIFHFGVRILTILGERKVCSTHLLVPTGRAEFFTVV